MNVVATDDKLLPFLLSTMDNIIGLEYEVKILRSRYMCGVCKNSSDKLALLRLYEGEPSPSNMKDSIFICNECSGPILHIFD